MLLKAVSILLIHVTKWSLFFLPDINWVFEPSNVSAFTNILRGVTYFLPMQTVAQIFQLVISLLLFRVGVAIVKVIWDMVPWL